MGSLLWYTIPIALAIALSIFPILAVLMLLLAPQPLARSIPFAIGWPLGLAILVTGFTVTASRIALPTSDSFPPWVHVVEIVLGLALVLITVILWRRSPKESASSGLDLEKLTSRLTPGRAFVFGLAMNIRPKNLLLTIAAGVAMGAAPVADPLIVLTVVLFVLVAGSSVALLVLAYAIGGKRIAPKLERLRAWLLAHSSVILHGLVIVVGLLLVGVGAAQLIAGT